MTDLKVRPEIKGERQVEIDVESGDPPWWRRHRRWVAVGVACTLGLVGLVLARSPLLDVNRIEVRSGERTPAAEVLERSGLRRGQPMLGLDDDGATRRIEELAWVRQATVERSWPGGVTIDVVERVPVAALAAGRRRWVLVDGEGRRLMELRRSREGIVSVRGLIGPSGPLGTVVGADARGAVALARMLPPALRMRLPAVQVTSEGRLEVRVRDRDREIVALLGRPEQLRAKVISLATVFETVELDGVVRIDLRRPRDPVLTRA